MNLNFSFSRYHIKVFNISFLIILLFSCNNSQIDESQIKTIDLKSAFEIVGNKGYEEIFEQINYIQLETNQNCIAGEYVRFYAGDTYILLSGFRQFYLFEKETGKFIKEIGEYSRGPLGYMAAGYSKTYVESQQIIFASDWDKSYCGYNFQGEKSIKFKKPSPEPIISCGYLNDSILAGYIVNGTGKEDKKIVFFNKTGKITKVFPNYLSYEKKSKSYHRLGYEGLFYNYEDHLFFKELFNDTLFEVKENVLAPRFVFEMGEFSPPYYKRDELLQITKNLDGSWDRELDDYFRIENICESLRFILFEFDYQKENYWGFYDKKDDYTKIFKNSGISAFGANNPIPFKSANAYVNNNGELISHIQAFELKEWLKENKSNQSTQFENFKSINETDNPIVLIIKLKD